MNISILCEKLVNTSLLDENTNPQSMLSASNEYELFSIMNYTLFLETTEYVSLAQL